MTSEGIHLQVAMVFCQQRDNVQLSASLRGRCRHSWRLLRGVEDQCAGFVWLLQTCFLLNNNHSCEVFPNLKRIYWGLRKWHLKPKSFLNINVNKEYNPWLCPGIYQVGWSLRNSLKGGDDNVIRLYRCLLTLSDNVACLQRQKNDLHDCHNL